MLAMGTLHDVSRLTTAPNTCSATVGTTPKARIVASANHSLLTGRGEGPPSTNLMNASVNLLNPIKLGY